MDSINSIQTSSLKPKSKSRLLTFLLTALVSITAILSIQTPLTVHAAGTDVEAEHSDGTVSSSSNSGFWYSTYAKGAGYKGQGVLMYLLEREGGGAVAGTTPKAYPCSATVMGYELHAQDKYNRYPKVTSWEGTTPPWGGPNSGGIMHGSTSSNVESIKAWLKTVHDGNSTQGIRMVQDIWGPDIAERFTNEELILIAEPILGIQYSQSKANDVRASSSLTLSQLYVQLIVFESLQGQSYYNTGMSADLLSIRSCKRLISSLYER